MPAALRGSRRAAARAGFLVALLAFAVLGAQLARGAPLAAQADGLGDENSWIRVANVGAGAASVDVTFYDGEGKRVAGDACSSSGVCEALGPGLGWSFFQQGFAGLPVGYRGSAFVRSDQPFVAVVGRDVFKGGQFQIGADSVRLGAGAASAVLPLVQQTGTHASRISVQNTSDSKDACVELQFWAASASVPAAMHPGGGGAGCPQGGARVAPRASLVLDERSGVPGGGFDGGALLRTFESAAGTRAADQTLAVTVDTRERGGAGLATSRAAGPAEVSRVVVLPQVDRNASLGGRSWSTRFRIMNARPGIANEVKLRYEGTDVVGDRVEIEHTVVVQSVLTCDQRASGAAGCLPGGRDLPASFTGLVRMQAVEPIAVVAQRIDGTGGLGDYRGFTAEEASRQVVLPVLDKRFGPFGEQDGWSSWLRIATFDGSVAHVRIIYYSKRFSGGLLRPAMSVDRLTTVRQADDAALPDGWVGSAVVVADRPVIVVANIESSVFRGDALMMYSGVSFD